MATKQKSKAKSPSMRESAAQARQKADKPRRLQTRTKAAGKPLRLLGKLLRMVFRPFRFVLIPFKTRPARFIGRLISKVLFLGYFINSWRELRQVEWPNRKQTIQLTLAVFCFAIVFATIVTSVDYGLDKLFRKVLLS